MTWMVSKRMDRTAKILLGGVAVAALVVGVGYAASIRANLHVSDLVAQCKTETAPTKTIDQIAAKYGGVPIIDPYDWEHAPLICDPEILRTTSRTSPSIGIQAPPGAFDDLIPSSRISSSGGIQTQIIDAQQQGERWLELATIIALGILILSAIPYVILSATPYVWYFLLRRVRELRDALVGK